MTTGRECKDCRAELVLAPGQRSPVRLRPAPHPGPRCATHHRVAMLLRKQRSAELRRQATYGLSPEEHAALLALQGGACAICQKARGVRRALAIDHDHALAREHDHDEDKGCHRCLRGALCKRCNRMLGEFRDDPETFERAANYLRYPPWRDVLTLRAFAPSASGRAASSSARPGSSASGVEATASSDERT